MRKLLVALVVIGALVVGVGVGVGVAQTGTHAPTTSTPPVTMPHDQAGMDAMHAQMRAQMPAEMQAQCDEMHAG